MTLFVIIFIWKQGLFSVEQNKESKKSNFFIFKKEDQDAGSDVGMLCHCLQFKL